MRTRRPTLEHALGITPNATNAMNVMNVMDAMIAMVRFVPLPLAIAIAFAITGGPSLARARERAVLDEPAAEVAVARAPRASDAPGPDEGIAWRPILAGCLGVFFGAAVAVWQIRGRNKHA